MTAVNVWVDAVYVLSVKSFADRIAHIQAQMARHGIVFEFVFEHDLEGLDDVLVSATFAASDLKPAQQSLVLKNIWVWRDALAKGHRRVLVFEDDAVLSDDFAAGFGRAMAAAEQLPQGWLVFLGGTDTKAPDRYFLSRGPLVELPIATAEGQVSDALAMARRLEWLASNRVTLPADHLIRRIDREQHTRQYWLRDPIVEQGSVLGTFVSTLDSHRQKHSLLFNKLRNRWNKFQRRRLRQWVIRLKAALGMGAG